MTPNPGDDRNDETGEFVRTRDPEAVLAVMKPLEPYGTRELADELGWPRRTAYHVLDELAEEGRVRKKKLEPRRVIWIRQE